MQVLLILNRGKESNLRIIVNVHTNQLKEKLISLLEDNKDRDAFDLLIKEAEVESYLAPGEKVCIRPSVTLIEDLL